MGNLKTVLHAYNLDTSKPEDKAAYDALCAKLKSGPHLMKSHDGGKTSYYFGLGQQLDGKEIELETAFLFENQWNTAPFEGSKDGWRVFDWAEDAIFSPYNGAENLKTRRGYWLEQTADMREIRRNTNVCGYCGKYQPAANGAVFCLACIDSSYLKEADLRMLRLRAVDEKFSYKSPELTEAERAYLLPLYRDAQTNGTTERGKKRLADLRAKIEKTFQQNTENARVEHEGFLWMLDRNLGPNLIENCIYYNHTGKFSFGWRSALDATQESAVLDVISEFPFPYEIKTADGRKLAAV